MPRITFKLYNLKKTSWWIGKKVRTLKDIQNGRYKIPKGTIFEIEGKYGGFDLRGLEVCPHCNIGLKIYISKVEPTNLELIDEGKDGESP